MIRKPSAEERALFESALEDTKPLKKKAVPEKKPVAKTEAVAKPKPVQQTIIAGLDGRTEERLRRGRLEPEARLDLHGLTEEAAHRALITFIRAASARGLRLILIVTGKGLKKNAPDEPFDLGLESRVRGVLKQMTPRWLAEPGMARMIADIRNAHRRHGGEGALYVYLRKVR